ncbi:response regulator transcription factor [Stenotrophomonas sp. HMWF003]|uniref:response regulator n=1 Tax=Stenotrophomonas sp. HMWF003 TaxID=2056840 RepID=UPI000D45EFB1|nr:response regulator transcription factor [Stenotrophomonas sp. HMWF003]PTT64667.1 hypothetical protein DBR34_04130 [Stenotrophomonas sp. HMWF003]
MQNIAVLDDHPVALAGIGILINRLPDVRLSGVYERSALLLTALKEGRHDAVVIDYELAPGELSGAELIGRILQVQPSINVIVLSGHQHPRMEGECLRAGASTVLSKREPLGELLMHLESAILS